MHWHARARGAHLAVLGLLVLLLSTVALTLSHAQEPQGLGLAVVSVGTTVRDMDRHAFAVADPTGHVFEVIERP